MEESHQQREQTLNRVCVWRGGKGGEMKASDVSERGRKGEMYIVGERHRERGRGRER